MHSPCLRLITHTPSPPPSPFSASNPSLPCGEASPPSPATASPRFKAPPSPRHGLPLAPDVTPAPAPPEPVADCPGPRLDLSEGGGLWLWLTILPASAPDPSPGSRSLRGGCLSPRPPNLSPCQAPIKPLLGPVRGEAPSRVPRPGSVPGRREGPRHAAPRSGLRRSGRRGAGGVGLGSVVGALARAGSRRSCRGPCPSRTTSLLRPRRTPGGPS